MRYVAIVLTILAIAKLATTDYLYKAAVRDVVVAAHGRAAVDACMASDPSGGDALKPGARWTEPGDIRVEIGDRTHTVRLWQVDHAEWKRRYRATFLVLTADAPGGALLCRYDVAAKSAKVQRQS